MKVTTYLIENADEMDQQERLGIQPKPIYKKYNLQIKISAIHLAYINTDGNIIAVLPDGAWVLEYSDELWSDIKDHLGK